MGHLIKTKINQSNVAQTCAKSKLSLRFKAFTLAEVLITLGIIGVVAVLTIPAIVQKTQDKETVTAVKKAYSILAQTLNRAVSDNGEINSWDLSGASNGVKSLKLEGYLKPYLNITKDCANSGGCFSSKYYQISGIEDGNGDSFAVSGSPFATAMLADGSYIVFFSSGTGGFLIIDINGNKSPNTYGRDTFWFDIDTSTNVLRPYAGWKQNVNSGSECDKTSATDDSENGRRCTGWVLRNENLDYTRCSDLNWTTKTTCN